MAHYKELNKQLCKPSHLINGTDFQTGAEWLESKLRQRKSEHGNYVLSEQEFHWLFTQLKDRRYCESI